MLTTILAIFLLSGNTHDRAGYDDEAKKNKQYGNNDAGNASAGDGGSYSGRDDLWTIGVDICKDW